MLVDLLISAIVLLILFSCACLVFARSCWCQKEQTERELSRLINQITGGNNDY